MPPSEQTQFMQGLAESLNSRKIALPSFPDVVIKIRTALEDPTCTAERLAEVARADPVLVSRLLRSVNSAFHNRAGIEIVDLSLAISRLGFETVRNTAIALAVEQIFDAAKHDNLRDRMQELWLNSTRMASMCSVLAQRSGSVSADSAFLSGLLNEVGKLYILTKAKDYPQFLGDGEALGEVMSKWSPSVGKSIVQAWGFPEDIAQTLDADNVQHSGDEPTLADVVVASRLLVFNLELALQTAASHGAFQRLEISESSIDEINAAYDICLSSMHQSIS